MIKFFRRIRQRLLGENKFSRYLIYAIGEILLVVIGILIALQLNTWNSDRIQNIELKDTYERMLVEITSTKRRMEAQVKAIDSAVLSKNKRSLYLLQLRDSDSIKEIYGTLRSLPNVVSVLYDMPTTTEFLNDRNITALQNDRLKALLLNIKQSLRFGEVVDNYANTQLNSLIEPFIMKNFNYAKMIQSRDMVQINSPTDYSNFFDNLELENLINLKIETDNTKIDYLRTFESILGLTAEEIKLELKNFE
jgi:hypothetical protein